MKKPQLPLGLVVEGETGGSSLLNLKKFWPQVGPIKANNIGAAKRLASTHRAGFAVSSLEELRATKLIFVRVPDTDLPRIALEIASSRLEFSRCLFAFAETWYGTESLGPIRARGAGVATVSVLPDPLKPVFLAEGDSHVTRIVKAAIASAGATCYEIQPGTKNRIYAAELLATAIPLQLLSSARTLLRDAGLQARPLSTVIDQLLSVVAHTAEAGGRIESADVARRCPRALAETHVSRAAELCPALPDLLALIQRTGLLPNSKEECKSATGGS